MEFFGVSYDIASLVKKEVKYVQYGNNNIGQVFSSAITLQVPMHQMCLLHIFEGLHS